MTMPGTGPVTAERGTGGGPILVATDATAASEWALRAAQLLADRDGAEVAVLSVLEPIAPLPPLIGGVPMQEIDDSARLEALREGVEEQLREAGVPDWPITVVTGQAGSTIARAASRSGARMIVLGIGRHQVSDRLFGSETALRALRRADVPILAVTPGFSALPRRVLAAVDFSASSLVAARVALNVAAENASIELAHVAPSVEPLLAPWERFGVQSEKVDYTAALRQTARTFGAPDGVTVTTAELRGSAAEALLEHAQKIGAELIVAGSHGFGFLQRMFVGSVATRLLRGSTVPVLVVPHSFAAVRAAETGASGEERRLESINERNWTERLKVFTERNAGRRCMIEVDDPAFGAQLQGADYPLRGVAYDRKDRRVEVMLGDTSGGNHLTKSISNVTSVDVVTSDEGRDRVLRIGHGTGQTLITIGG
jgi:nucleotide-binding universal stress UspA family protein